MPAALDPTYFSPEAAWKAVFPSAATPTPHVATSMRSRPNLPPHATVKLRLHEARRRREVLSVLLNPSALQFEWV
jgi:hypothetical protein